LAISYTATANVIRHRPASRTGVALQPGLQGNSSAACRPMAKSLPCHHCR